MNMGKIFCIMGKSSSGKDTLYKQLLEEEGLRLSRIYHKADPFR